MRLRPHASALVRLLRQARRDERGYSLIELMTAMAILGIVLSGFTGVFVSSTSAQVDLTNRFGAQQEARLALDRIRREVHCASAATLSAPNLLLTLPLGCPTGSGSVTWCVLGSGSRYTLRRAAGATCNATSLVIADYLTTSVGVFAVVPQSPTSLAKVDVDFKVDVKPASSGQPEDTIARYRLTDGLVLRNSTRCDPGGTC
ncbi:MAG: prepilin-type N-terminal cleavage/methylation domain-containing protein [Actinobacteria bacterium]|nr:prepilin-type N-terminal cleavage/methylation domain-containing protein [Actinomycetota bacterium]